MKMNSGWTLRLGMALLCAWMTGGVIVRAQTAVMVAPATPAAKPSPDVIVFTNGDQLSGKLLRGVGGSVVFKSDMAGEITVSLDKVKELRSTGSFAVLRKGAPVTRTPALTGTVLYADGSMTLGAGTSSSAVQVPAKEVAFLIDESTYSKELKRHPSATHGWNGAINGGATLVRSTTNANTYTMGVALARVIPTVPYLPARNRTTLNVRETYGKLTTPNNPQAGLVFAEVKTSIFHADAERDEYFSPRFYALANVAFDHNYAQGLSVQQLYGGGIGWTPIKTPLQQLDVKADVHYERQTFLSLIPGATPSADQSLVGSTISNAYRRTLPRKLVFTEVASILPAFNNLDAYSANVTASLALPVYKRLSAQISTTDNYLNDPPTGFRKNSYQFVTGVSYTLH